MLKRDHDMVKRTKRRKLQRNFEMLVVVHVKGTIFVVVVANNTDQIDFGTLMEIYKEDHD